MRISPRRTRCSSATLCALCFDCARPAGALQASLLHLEVRRSTSAAAPSARNTANNACSRRLLAGCIYTGAAITWVHFVLAPTIEIVDEEEEEEGDEEEDDDWDEDEEYEDDALFIPLGWTKPVPRRFYKGSDPEWQEFRKVAADQKRHEQIRRMYGLVLFGMRY